MPNQSPFDELGLTRAPVEDMIEPALQHPMVTLNTIRPIVTAADLRAVMQFAWSDGPPALHAAEVRPATRAEPA